MAKINKINQRSEDVVEPIYEPPADGWYTIQVYESDFRENHKKNNEVVGDALTVKYEILDEDVDHKFNGWFYTRHKNDRTESSGLHEYNQLCKSIGLPGYDDVEDSEQLHFQPFRAHIVSKPQKDNPKYTNTNITKWGCDEDGDATKQVASPQQSGSSQGGGSAAAGAGGDWRNKGAA